MSFTHKFPVAITRIRLIWMQSWVNMVGKLSLQNKGMLYLLLPTWSKDGVKQMAIAWHVEYDESCIYLASIHIVFCRPQRFGFGYFGGLCHCGCDGWYISFYWLQRDYSLYSSRLMAVLYTCFGFLVHWHSNNAYKVLTEGTLLVWGHFGDLVTKLSTWDKMRQLHHQAFFYSNCKILILTFNLIYSKTEEERIMTLFSFYQYFLLFLVIARI